VPLVQHLSNAEFGRMVRNIAQISKNGAGKASGPVGNSLDPASASGTCACGCGDLVYAPRKFVNQEHYNVWMRRRRYWGRNQPHSV
jgi:hypothetical protein